MRNKIGKIVLTLSLILCVVMSMKLFDVNAEKSASGAIDDCSKVFKEYTTERATAYLKGDNTVPKKEGYLFAGWYTTNDLTKINKQNAECIIQDSIPEGVTKVYALFVPEDVLTVKAQASAHLGDDEVNEQDETGVIRFVTSVDSLLYQEVGFEVSYFKGDKEVKKTNVSKTVYTKLYKADSKIQIEVTPQEEFCAASEYFKVFTINKVYCETILGYFEW